MPDAPPPARTDAKLRRWLDLLLALLSRRRGLTFEELKLEVPGYGEPGVNEATIRQRFERDKRELKVAGIPLTCDDASETYSLKGSDFYLPYLTLVVDGQRQVPPRVEQEGYRGLGEVAFDQEGLLLIKEAATRAAALGDPLLAEHARDAVRTLTLDLPLDSVELPPVHHAPGPDRIPDALFRELDLALRTRKRVRFHYHGMQDAAPRAREVEPYGLFFLGHHWYLAGPAPGEAQVKNYRLSRMSAVEILQRGSPAAAFQRPASFRLREWAQSKQAWELGTGDGEGAVVEFRAASGPAHAARQLGEAIPGAPDRRRFVMRRPEVLARLLLSFGGAVAPVEPPALVAAYRTLLAATLAAYEAPDA